MRKTTVNYVACGDRVMLPPPDPCTHGVSKQEFVSLECDYEKATLQFNGTFLILPFDAVETMYNEMKLKRGE